MKSLEIIKKVAGYCEWVAFIALTVLFGCYAVRQDAPVIAAVFFAATIGLLAVMVVTASPRRSPASRFPANIPVGNPIVYALLAYFSYEAWIFEPVWRPLIVGVMVVVVIGFLRWLVSLFTD